MHRFIAVALVALCAACASQQPKFAPPQQMRKIAIIAVREPQQFIVANRSIGNLFMPFMSMAEPGETKRNSEDYVRLMNDSKKSLATALGQSLKDGLATRYEIVFIEQRPKLNSDGKTLDYSVIKTDADAILHVFYGGTGYMVFREQTTYLPLFALGATLIDTRTHEPLYAKQFLVQPGSAWGDPREVLESDRRYSYASAEDLLASFEESYKGLVETQQAIAQRIVADLTGNAGK